MTLLSAPPRAAALLVLLALAGAAACHGAPPPGSPPPGTRARLAFAETTLLPCPGDAFLPEPATVVVPDDARPVPFGPGHTLAFEPGALPPGTRVRVTLPAPGRAALRFDVADSLRAFGAPVRLTVNYAPCGAAAGQGVDYNLYQEMGDGLFPAGGATVGRTVTTLLESFSIYMIGGNRSAPTGSE